jgi:uncharacterized membrane protein YdjX (TVP38/TMEM64 family)
MQVFVSRRDRNNALRWLAVGAVVLVVGYAVARQYAPFLSDVDALRAWLEGFGVLAPLAFVCLQALQIIIAPIPGQVVVLLGGFLFGAVSGTMYSILGAALGSAVVFWLSRTYGRRYVERVVAPPIVARFDRLSDDRALLALFVGFLVPGLPDDVLCFVAGLTEISLWKLLVVSVVGRIPSYALVSFMGVELANENLLTVGVLLFVLVALAVVSYVYRDRIVGRFDD